MDHVRVVLPSQLQKADFRRRLAAGGGAVGVRLQTFPELALEMLEMGQQPVAIIQENIQKLILQKAAAEITLDYYREIKNTPGFIEVIFDFIRELKAGGITPEDFLNAVRKVNGNLRLRELGLFYSRYQEYLELGGWEDKAGCIHLAANMLDQGEESIIDQGVLFLDGFDNFSPEQLRLIKLLAGRIPEMEITLTGSMEAESRQLIQGRFYQTREALLKTGLFQEHELIQTRNQPSGEMRKILERNLFNIHPQQESLPESFVTLAALPNRSEEVRHALRWLKKGIVKGDFKIGRSAVIARNIEPYRNHLLTQADEFNIPLRFVGGRPLKRNPAVDTVLSAVELIHDQHQPLHWRKTIAVLKSPYLNWGGAVQIQVDDRLESLDRIRIRQLELAARWGSVIAGYQQWMEALRRLEAQPSDPKENSDALIPWGQEATILKDLFQEMVKLVTPPRGKQTGATFAEWIQKVFLFEDDADQRISLNLLAQVCEAPESLKRRDLAAVQEFINQLRGIIAADRAVKRGEISFQTFLADLKRAVDNAGYAPYSGKEDSVLVLDVAESRGLDFEAVALLGLAEGEFPAEIREDPFLRDRDREEMADVAGLALNPSTESADEEYFYEVLLRASKCLLVTRPRLTETGAVWQSSPFWEDLKRISAAEPELRTSQSRINFQAAASWQEVFSLASELSKDDPRLKNLANRQSQKWDQIQLGAAIAAQRTSRDETKFPGYDGELIHSRAYFRDRYGPGSTWSASRLETYRMCPFAFLIGSVLGLEPLETPREGLDARQLGNIYHRIMEQIYEAAGNGATVDELLERLDQAADFVLDSAPEEEGFRETAWWEQSRKSIKMNIYRGIQVLERIDPAFDFKLAEAKFGLPGDPTPALVVVRPNGDSFQLRGLIDRVDVNPEQATRIIDYKTSSPGGFHAGAFRKGEKLQLPLYALAAQEALSLGPIQEGFYFHIRSGERSSFQLSQFRYQGRSGPDEAIQLAVRYAWEAVLGARSGSFRPVPPQGGCPTYCPAAAFCWHYEPRSW